MKSDSPPLSALERRPGWLIFKLWSVSAIALAAVGIFIVAYFPVQLRKHSRAAMASKAEALATVAARDVQAPLQFNAPEELQESLAALQQVRDLAFLVVRDRDGKVVASHDPQGWAASPPSDLLTTVRPVMIDGRVLGWVDIGLSMGSTELLVAESQQTAVAITLVVIAGSSLLFLLLGRVVLAPLDRLESAMVSVASGEFHRRAPVQSRDEFGNLAQRFNQMVDQLQAARFSLEEANEELERRVEDRTRELWTEVLGQMETEDRLRDSEEKFRSIVNLATDVIFIKDPQSRYALINPAGQRAMGCTQDEILGKTDLELFPNDADSILAYDDQVRSTGQTTTYEASRQFRQVERWYQNTKIPYETSAGTGIIGLSRDITESREAQAALQRSVKEKEELLKEVHHRVKNNLQVIVSLLNLQTRTTDNPEVQSILRESRDRVRSMALIHEMLYRSEDFARIDLSRYLSELGRMLTRSYGVSSTRITLDLDVEPRRLGIGTAVPCALIVTELISNAFKHGFPDGRSGTVSVRLRALDSGEVELLVQDDGVGLTPDATEKRAGIGLELVADLAVQLGGKMNMTTGKGTHVRMLFPELGDLEQ